MGKSKGKGKYERYEREMQRYESKLNEAELQLLSERIDLVAAQTFQVREETRLMHEAIAAKIAELDASADLARAHASLLRAQEASWGNNAEVTGMSP